MRRDRLLRGLVRERFVVTLKTGETFDGLLDEVDDRTLTFVGASAVSAEDRARVDGTLYLPREQVRYMQQVAP